MMTLGQYIREARDKKDISLREFAKEIDVSAAFLSDIELGRRYPSTDNLKKIAQKLSIQTSELQKYDSRPPIEDMRIFAQRNPQFAFAFRSMVDSGLTPEAIMKFAKSERVKTAKAAAKKK